MEESALRQQIQTLFREAGQAHHEAYIETDGDDPEWPIWYADYLHERLSALLEASFTKSELVFLLIDMSKEQSSRAPGANWARYYTRYLLDRYH